MIDEISENDGKTFSKKEERTVHVLVLPSWYPSTYNAILGSFFKEQAEALAKYGHKVGVVSIQDIGWRNMIRNYRAAFSSSIVPEKGVHTYRVQYVDMIKHPFVKRKIEMYFFKKMVQKYIQEQGVPDIVHLHAFMAGDFALYLKEQYHIPFVVTEHLSGFLKKEISDKEMQKATEVYSCASDTMAVSRYLQDVLKNTFSKPFIYMPNSVDMDFFTRKTAVEHTEHYMFIHIAHLDRNKNQRMLIEAFYHAFKYHPHIHLTIVGDGSEYASLDTLIASLSMKAQIRLYGSATREEVKMLLHQSDAFVLSSCFETFGVVLIEAMACGIPVLSTRCGGPESIITDEKLGLLCDIDEKSLSKKLLEMYNKRETYSAAYIRHYAEEHFSQTTICERLTKRYEEVLR